MRKLIYVPEINPRTFLFFFVKGDSGRSYSLRDYTSASGVQVTYAKQYRYTAAEILRLAKYRFEAEAHDTNDVQYWRAEVVRLNRKYLASEAPSGSGSVAPSVSPAPVKDSANSSDLSRTFRDPSASAGPQSAPVSSAGQNFYPLFAPAELLAHPVKGRKPQDLERIFHSQRSEDWVTWNVVKLLSMVPAATWWPAILEHARNDNPGLTLSVDADDLPLVKPWVLVPAPSAYEKSSRARMAQSANPEWAARARDARPVEGISEIDIVLWMDKQIGFVEAKLGADISMATTYDPQRNQIARNVDCLIEQSAGRTPFFWMLTADRGPGRAYTQLVQRYRTHPEILSSELPHRSPAVVQSIARNMAIVVWKDVLAVIRLEFDHIWNELEARVSGV